MQCPWYVSLAKVNTKSWVVVDLLAILFRHTIFVDEHCKIRGRINGHHRRVPGGSTIGYGLCPCCDKGLNS